MGFCWSPVFSDTYRRGQLRQQNPGTKKWDGESRYHPYFILNQSLRLHPRSSQLVEDFFCTARALLVDLGRGLFCDLDCFTSDGSSDPCRWKGHSSDLIQVWSCTGCASESLKTWDAPPFLWDLFRTASLNTSRCFTVNHSLARDVYFSPSKPFKLGHLMWIITFSQLVSSCQKFLAHGSQLQIFKKGWQWKSQVGQKIQASSFISSQILKSLKS